MALINILDPHVADMIAAGEVVERPASVIKELLENSFDAGAKNITVEIRSGGTAYIRVNDDGCGMAPEDAGVAFLRHATSKLKDEKGLESIGTMGFRGEALAAIASVSRIELVTRKKGDTEGTKVILDAGDIQDMQPTGCPEGTQMLVQDLFFNTPARRKFLKTDRSEAAACIQAALRCALGRPEVSVRFIRDGKEEFFSPGDGRLDSCVYSLLGRDLAKTLLPVSGNDGGYKLSGFVSSPAAGRGNRGCQYFFCNGRCIRSALLQAALEQAYKNSMLTGRFPACVLYLDVSCGSVDVNVHPAKIEIKFAEERRVFDLVHYAVRSALEGENKPIEAELAPSTKKAIEPKADFYRSMNTETYKKTVSTPAAPVSYTPATPVSRVVPQPVQKKPEISFKPNFSTPADNGKLSFHSPVEQIKISAEPEVTAKSPSIPAQPTAAPVFNKQNVENYVQNVGSEKVIDYKIVGEALKTYIIVEKDGELILIDKHAAHERIIFDRLKAQDREIMSQSLLISVPLKLSAEDLDIIESRGELLSELGFEIELFGEGQYVVRAVPADMAGGDALAAIEEICEKLRRGRALDAQSARDEILHTVACKAAIKAGWDTHKAELEKLVQEVLSGKVKYCPHGRPVAVTMSRKELDKLFKRIV